MKFFAEIAIGLILGCLFGYVILHPKHETMCMKDQPLEAKPAPQDEGPSLAWYIMVAG